MPDITNGSKTALEWIWRVATVIIVPLLVWVALTLRDLDQRITVIEANRPTRSEIMDRDSQLRAEMIVELRLLREEVRQHREATGR